MSNDWPDEGAIVKVTLNNSTLSQLKTIVVPCLGSNLFV